jgi:serine/threonine-protein kinase
MYAVGVILWELCAGRRFLQGDAQEHTAMVASGERSLPAIASLIGAPPELDAVIAKMTATERDDRYSSCRAATSALAALLKDAPALPNGERGIRARAAQVMYTLYPAEPGRARREFARLIASARDLTPEPWEPLPEPEPQAETEDDGFLPGTRYRLRGEVGRGSSSVVHEAEHVDLGRRVAVKLLDAEHTNSRDFAVRFRREARALSRLHHPGLVRVFDFGQADDGRLYCVMELIEGTTLAAALDREEYFDWRRSLRIARQACLALHAAHSRDVVHRDIKPHNLFLAEGDEVKLIDFGLAKTADELGDIEESDERAQQIGAMTLFGTPEYIAPEQAAGGRVDHRADLYALGCVLYEMLSGRLPFVASSDVKVLDAKLRGNPDPVRERAPNRGIPRAVGRLVMKSLARHPSRRFQSALEMAKAISVALDEPSRQRSRRRAIGASVVAGVMAFGLVLVGQQARPWLEALPADMPWMEQNEQPDQERVTPDERHESADPGELDRPEHASEATAPAIDVPKVVIAE